MATSTTSLYSTET